MEVKPQSAVLDLLLAAIRAVAGDVSTISDSAVSPSYGALVTWPLYGASAFLSVKSYGTVLRWTAEIAKRPAARHPSLARTLPPDSDRP